MITNKIYYGDAINLSKLLPNDYLDLVITSPPYVTLKNYGKKVDLLSPDHYNDWFLPLAYEIGRSLKTTGSFILNINDKVVNGFRDLYVFELVIRICNETDLKLYDRYIWHKKNAMPVGSGDRLNDWMEYIFHFSRTNKIKSNIDIIREPYAESTIKRYKSPVAFNKKVDDHGITSMGDKKIVKQNPKGKKPATVMRFNNAGVLKGGTAGKHPAPFHPDLPKFFIKWLTDENDIVLDPFIGSGTVAEVCKSMNRQYIGFELNESYKELIDKRLS
jgi:DNA modification methylase